MKALLTLTTLIAFTACQGNTATNSIETPVKKRITSISCETRDGWKEFQTYNTAYESYGSRSGIWQIRLITGGIFTATNCHAFEDDTP